MPGSNLYPNTVSLPVLTMTEQGNGNAGASSVPTTMEQLEQVLKDATATNKRNSEALDEHGQRSDALLAQIGHLQQLVQSNHSGLSDEGKKARIAPGTTFKDNGPQKLYSRTLPLVEGLEAVEAQAALMVANPTPEGIERLYETVQSGEHRR